MNTQEHIKNCKECGNGFYWQGFEVCHDCKVKRQGMCGGKDHREAQRQVNMMYSDLANMVASKSKEELREIGRKAAHQGYIDGLFWYWVIQFALFCSACIFAFILYMHIFKL